ncbi:MAG: Gfo/Idh/MocA family protein [Faecalibacterium sp.]
MNIGIIGTSAIARTMAQQFARTASLRVQAVCSRSAQTGSAFAQELGIPKVFTRLEEMLADPEVELVYIASPNALHFAQARAALEAGRHVLCEKPFVPTVAEADALIALAQERGLMLFEAITTAHHPNYAFVRENLPALGPVKVVSCTFCQYSSRYPALKAGQTAPVFDPAFAGGALMDINLYNVHFVVGLFGAPQAVHYVPNRWANGIDTSGILLLEYPGFVCQCTGAKDCAAENSVQIVGEAGYLTVRPGASNCQEAALCLRGQPPRRAECPGSPWSHEVQALERLLSARDTAACRSALQVTRTVVAVLEAARKDAGMGF